MKLQKKQMQFLLLIVLLLLVYSTWAVSSAEDKGGNHEGIIRFHVIANSDSAEDQSLKLMVRDGVLAAVNKGLVKETMKLHDPAIPATSGGAAIEAGTDADAAAVDEIKMDLDQTRIYIEENIGNIEAAAEEIIRQEGYDYEVKAELGVCWIPKKTYGDTVFPAGNYEALNITIGEGKGQNWWCVLFPPLCIIDPEGETLAGMEQAASGGIQLKFKTKELVDHLRGSE